VGLRGLGKRYPAGHDRSKVMGRGETELDIYIGKPEIAVEQQDTLPGLRQSMRQSNGKPSLPDAALTRGNR
jgi:hypothetical protein